MQLPAALAGALEGAVEGAALEGAVDGAAAVASHLDCKPTKGRPASAQPAPASNVECAAAVAPHLGSVAIQADTASVQLLKQPAPASEVKHLGTKTTKSAPASAYLVANHAPASDVDLAAAVADVPHLGSKPPKHPAPHKTPQTAAARHLEA